MINWRGLVAVALVPVLVAGGAYLLLSRPAGTGYRVCLEALGGELSSAESLQVVTDALIEVGRPKGRRWNVNQVYDPKAVNLLLPRADIADWPKEACGLPRRPPNCRSHIQEMWIICNPGMAAFATSQQLHGPPFQMHETMGMRFLVLMLLGHEIGHLELGKDRKQGHIYNFIRPNGLSCKVRDEDIETIEEKADSIGSEIGCQGLKLNQLKPISEYDWRELLDLNISIERLVGGEFFDFDDACIGDIDYPSIARRRFNFEKNYLKCYVKEEENLIAFQARREVEAFKHLERLLRARQIFGYIGSPRYGEGGLYHYFTSAGPKGSVISFDSSGVDSEIWHVNRNAKEVTTSRLRRWDRAGRVVDVRGTKSKQAWLLEISGNNNTLILMEISCVGLNCQTSISNRDIEFDARPVLGEDGTFAIVTSRKVISYPSLQEFMNGLGGTEVPRLIVAEDEEPRLTAGNGRVVVLPFWQDGIYKGEIFYEGQSHELNLSFSQLGSGWIEAIKLEGSQLQILIREDWVLEKNTNPQSSPLWFWDCLLVGELEVISEVKCRVYQGPEQLLEPVALAVGQLGTFLDSRVDSNQCSGVISISYNGWIWIIDRDRARQDVLAGDGVVRCSTDAVELETFRARRIDRQRTLLKPIEKVGEKLLTFSKRS